MRFMIMHKLTPTLEKGEMPAPEVLQKIGAFMGDAMKSGVFLGGEGLKPTAHRTHITYADGKRTVVDGPFTEAKELIAGFAVMAVKSKEEALMWCDRFAEANGGNVELHLGAVVENWDLGFGPKPADAPLRFLSLVQATRESENDAMPDPACMERMGALIAEMTKAGVLQATDGLTSTKHGARLHFEGGKTRVIDGPYTESKELISGYSICNLPSLGAAIEFATKFGEVLDVHEIDIRLMPEHSPAS